MKRNIIETVKQDLTNRKDRSAWNKGVTAYALELVEGLQESGLDLTDYNGKELEKAMLNGADSWEAFSWGGCSLIYDNDIAERLCTPSELKRTRNGERKPNSREEWLDTQARALFQACNRVKRIIRGIIATM